MAMHMWVVTNPISWRCMIQFQRKIVSIKWPAMAPLLRLARPIRTSCHFLFYIIIWYIYFDGNRKCYGNPTPQSQCFPGCTSMARKQHCSTPTTFTTEQVLIDRWSRSNRESPNLPDKLNKLINQSPKKQPELVASRQRQHFIYGCIARVMTRCIPWVPGCPWGARRDPASCCNSPARE